MRVSLLFLIVMSASSSLLANDNWEQFRGPAENGHAQVKEIPLKWNEKENIVWKTPIHDHGWSSPVIWGNQVWMTSSTADGHKLFAICVDKNSGKVIHDIHVFDVEKPDAIAPENTYASPTSVIEEGRVYVHYGTNGTACLETATGKILWTRRDLKCEHEAGANSSPFLVENMFIVNVDGRDVQYVIALDKTTGKNIWKTDRSVDYSKVPVHQRKGYTMPILIPRGSSNQLVSPGGRGIFSYDPDTGKELWKIQHRGWSIAPRPIYGLGMIFVMMDHDHPELWAIRPDGNGDVTDSHIVWKATRGIPARSSSILIDDLIFFVNRQGILSCLEAKTGKLVWKKRIKGNFSASPIYAKGRIYFINEDATCTVIKPSRKYELLAVNPLAKEQFMSSPAAVGKSLFLRTENHLYRIENSTSK